MKNFYIVALTLVFFVSNAFGYSCYFRPYSGDIRVADINGRQIYTLFSTHLSLNQSQEFFTIVSSAVDISEEITMFLVRHADIIRSERSDFQQIISLLTSQKINWIGIEQYPYKEATEKFVQLYRQFKETIFYDGMPQEETDDLLYVIFPVEIKLLAEYPNDIVLDETNGIKIISLEDESLHKESKNKHSELSSKIPEETSNITNEQLLAFLEFAYTDDDETPFHLIDSQELKIFFFNPWNRRSRGNRRTHKFHRFGECNQCH